VLTVRGKIE